MYRPIVAVASVILLLLSTSQSSAQEVVDEVARETAAQAQQNVSTVAGGVAALQERIDELEQRLNAITEPLNVLVDCAAGGTVADALVQAAGTIAAVTITISGICEESVVITRDDLTMRGQQLGDGLKAPLGPFVALTLRGAQRVVLDQLTLEGGTSGLVADEGAAFRANNLHVHNATRSGIGVVDASALLENATVEDNDGPGILAFNSARVNTVGALIQNNGGDGISVQRGSSALIQQTSVLGNGIGGVGNRGVFVFYGSHVTLDGATLSGNNGDGVTVTGGSSLILGFSDVAVTEVSGNTENGVTIQDTSVAGLAAFDAAVVKDNGGWGVFCTPDPAGVAQIAKVGPSFGLDATSVFGNNTASIGAGNISCPGLSIP